LHCNETLLFLKQNQWVFGKISPKFELTKKPYNIAKFLYMVQEAIQKYIRMLKLFPFMFLLVTKFGLNSLWMRITTTLATSEN
jgi:hypothetical protein